jgi:hypothetical protein
MRCILSLSLVFCLCACQAVTPTPDQFVPTPTDVYHFGSGGPISIEKLLEMESQDPTIVKQIEWLNTWGDWYGSADPSIRPMTSGEARTDIVFYDWTGSDGSTHYKVAWKFDVAGYQGYVLVPPAINWKDLNPPVAAVEGHEIGPGQGPVLISVECLDGSDLAKMGVPVGARLSPEQGTGDWVMVYNDKVVARVDASGVWRLEAPTPTPDVSAQVLAELNSEIQPVSDIMISGNVHDTIPIGIELVTSASLNDPTLRYDRLMGPAGLSETYPGDAEQAVLKTVFKGIYYAWQSNDGTQVEARKNVTEAQFAQMWKDGKDVTIKIWAYDMMAQEYVWKGFDPRTQVLEGVFLDDDAGKTVQKLIVPETKVYDDDAFATILTPDGKIQLWMYPSATIGDYQGPTNLPSRVLLLALQRLAWFPDQQTTSPIRIPRDPETYHTDMTKLMTIWIKGTGSIGPLSAPTVVK